MFHPSTLFPAFLLAASLAAHTAAANCAPPKGAESQIRQTTTEIANYRKAAGLSALKQDKTLAAIAQAHACDIAATGRISHEGSDGSTLKQRLQRGGYRFRAAVENLAQSGTNTKVTPLWYNSPGHRKNILSPRITDFGLAFALGKDGKTYWVMVGAAR